MPPRRDPIEAALAALDHAASGPSDEAAGHIAEALASRQPIVVARAAVLAAELDLRELEPALIDAYLRLSADPEKLDPVCAAMKEITAVLFEWGSAASEVYLHGAAHVQLAGWDNQDVGAPLRGLAVQALVKIEHLSALTLATDLLNDGLPLEGDRDDGLQARIGAAKALRALGSEAGAHVLRFKAGSGDPSAEIMGECFGAMLEYSPSWLDVIAHHLAGSNDANAVMAALAIGEARPPGALDYLREAWETQTQPDVRETLLNAIASLRTDEAVAYLVGLVGGETLTAMQAMSALTLFAGSPSVVPKIAAAAKANRRREVAAMFSRLFE